MPKIDHVARKHRVVAESVRLFATYGYAQVNFGLIAKESGVARTQIYKYFTNKRAIFNEAIDEVTRTVRAKYEEVAATALGADAKLRAVCRTVFDLMFGNRNFICVISDVLAGYRRKGGSVPTDRVIAHTSGFLRILETLVSEGVEKGEYRPGLDPARTAELIYSQYEATALRIAITGNAERAAAIDGLDLLLRGLVAQGR